MNFFKILWGDEKNLPTNINEGCCYFTKDTNILYIDYKDNNNNLVRKAIRAKELADFNISSQLVSNNAQIPTSKAVYDFVKTEMSSIQLDKIIIPILQSDPTNPQNGEIWIVE